MAENRRYRFVAHYRAGDLIWEPGQEIDVSEDYAAWLNRDVPGCLVEVDVKAEAKAKADAKAEAEAEADRAAEKPPHDRMQRQPESKRGT